MELTKRQKNEIWESLEARDVDPAECSFRPNVLGGDPVIRHQPTKSSFTIHVHHGDRWGGTSYSASTTLAGKDLGEFTRCSWQQLLEQVEEWAIEVSYEAEEPDRWEELQRARETIAAIERLELSNTPFTPDEVTEIAARADQVKTVVRERFGLPSVQFEAISEKLDQVLEASTRLGRKDWLGYLFSAGFSLIVTDAVPPSVVQTVLGMIIHGVAHIFGLGSPPPAIPM